MSEKVSFIPTEEEVKRFLSANYGLDSKPTHQRIGQAIVDVLNTFEISKDRECFFSQRVKDIAIKNLIKSANNNSNQNRKLRDVVFSNYFHSVVHSEIKMFLYYRKYPQFLEMK